MNITQTPAAPRFGVGHVAAAAIAAWVIYALVGGLDTIGRHFVVLGGLRIVLFAALLTFALSVGAHTHGLGRLGILIAAVGAAGFLVGSIGSVATDGWSYDPFAPEVEALSPPWYAYVIGLSGMLFALGTLLVGIAARSSGRLALAVILAGLLFPLAFALDGYGHIIWLLPWMALAAGLIATPTGAAKHGLQPVQTH